MDIVALTPTIGADVHGVDLNELDDSSFPIVHKALLEHQVLPTTQ